MVEGHFDPDRLVAAVAGELSGDEFACYWMISTLIIGRGGPVPDDGTRDKLKSIFRGMHGRTVNAALERLVGAGKLMRVETPRGPCLMTDFAQEQLLRAEERHQIASINGAKGGRPSKSVNGHANGHAVNGSQPHAPADLFGDALPVLDDAKAAKAKQYDAEFKIWYAGYPLKKAPDAALRAFHKARSKATLEQLIAGAKRYSAEVDGRDKDKIAHPATWLNAGRWKDEPPQSGAVPDFGRPWA